MLRNAFGPVFMQRAMAISIGHALRSQLDILSLFSATFVLFSKTLIAVVAAKKLDNTNI
jgi:hypothetical protein